MNEAGGETTVAGGVDIGSYCRRVEEHLTRINEGHLIRIVGPAFELVRAWATDGIPLAVVIRGVERKMERHRAGQSRRPLRLEFCELDVRETYDEWRRAIGFPSVAAGDAGTDESAGTSRRRSRPSLGAHLDRAVDRLARTAGRLELSDRFRDHLNRVIDEVTTMREGAKAVRGAAREPLMQRLAELDVELLTAASAEAGDATLGRLRDEASADLAAYRDRLDPDGWNRSVMLTADRLLRDRFALPTLEFEP